MFSWKFCEISKNIFSYRTFSVAASVNYPNSYMIVLYFIYYKKILRTGPVLFSIYLPKSNKAFLCNLSKLGSRSIFYLHKSSCLEMFCSKVVLQNFAKLIGKHICQSLFFNKVACFHSPKGSRNESVKCKKLGHHLLDFSHTNAHFNVYISCHLRCYVKEGAIRNFAKFTWRHLCQTTFSNIYDRGILSKFHYYSLCEKFP